MEALIVLMLCVAAALIVPLILILLVLRFLASLVLLPFRIVAFGLRLVGGVIKLVAGLAIAALSVGAVMLALLLALVAIPLLPLAFLAAFFWLIFKLAEPRQPSIRVS